MQAPEFGSLILLWAAAQLVWAPGLWAAQPVPSPDLSLPCLIHGVLDDASYETYLHENQDRLEAEIGAAIRQASTSRTPPEAFAGMSEPWAEFVDQLPMRSRKAFILKLLEDQGKTPASAADLIAGLRPEPGVREAVVDFLSHAPFMPHPGFNEEQLARIFGNGRFKRFFPWVHDAGTRINAHDFHLALRTSPARGGGSAPLEAARQDEGYGARRAPEAPNALGMWPAPAFPFLTSTQMKVLSNPATAGPALRGLIVQGAYERQGYSFPAALPDAAASEGRKVAPISISSIEYQLKAGQLSHRSDLEKRLFIENWSLNDSPELIRRIRAEAIWIADHDRSFWNLRNDIHEAQTWENVRRAEAFLSNYHGSQEVRRRILALICDLKTLLSPDSPSRIEETIRNLRGSQPLRTSLSSLLHGYAELPAVERLARIRRIRTEWRDSALSSDFPLTLKERFSPDRLFSQQALAEGSLVVERMKEQAIPTDPPRVLAAGSEMIHQVRLDDLLSDAQAEHLIRALEAAAASELPAPDRLQAMSSILKNAVDQVYFRLRREFGSFDERLLPLVSRPEGGGAPVRFVDELLRSRNTLPLSQLADQVDRAVAASRNIRHEIAGSFSHDPIEAFNPGEKVGTLRFNPDPRSLTPDDIAVFDQMPGEAPPLGGVITLGGGARLSHLQLLARSLRIPNARFAKSYVERLKSLDGEQVHYVVQPGGRVRLSRVGEKGDARTPGGRAPLAVRIATPDHSQTSPMSFEALSVGPAREIAGPKGTNLARLRAHPGFRGPVPDGFVVPFGFFDQYADRTGLRPLLRLLGAARLGNPHLVSVLAARVRRHILEHPVPDDLLEKVMKELERLRRRTGHEGGYFFRSDTNIEDLPQFNGAGLNESVPNVRDRRDEVQRALRTVWISPFREDSIHWRAMALGSPTVTIAEPSVVVMPTVAAESSGVILSRGGRDWRPGHGSISANWGIGSVVQAEEPVEEISLEGRIPLRTSLTVSTRKPVPDAKGGLSLAPVEAGQPVLSDAQIASLRREASRVEQALGPREHGWDIEWAIDAAGRIRILQARPNM